MYLLELCFENGLSGKFWTINIAVFPWNNTQKPKGTDYPEKQLTSK